MAVQLEWGAIFFLSWLDMIQPPKNAPKCSTNVWNIYLRGGNIFQVIQAVSRKGNLNKFYPDHSGLGIIVICPGMSYHVILFMHKKSHVYKKIEEPEP